MIAADNTVLGAGYIAVAFLVVYFLQTWHR